MRIGQSLEWNSDQDPREKFKQKLIFYNETWYEPSECVWDFALVDLGTPKICQAYSSLHSFFVDLVGVPTVDAAWLIERLQISGRTANRNAEELKKLLLELGARTAANKVGDESVFEEQMNRLKRSASKFLPVRQHDQRLGYCKVSDPFLINNHDGYATKFREKADMLDFTAEEARKMHWFLVKLQLDDKYLATRVTTLTEPESSELDQARTLDFRSRSYALSWYVNSPCSLLKDS